MTVIERLAARAAIGDVLARFARGVDRRDWDLVRSAYHPGAFDDHGDYKGDINGLVDVLVRRHATLRRSFHFLGNCLIEFADDTTAHVETYVRVIQSSPGADDTITNGACRYVDRFEERVGEWRIVHRTVVPESCWVAQELPLSGNWAQPRRDRSDPLYTSSGPAHA